MFGSLSAARRRFVLAALAVLVAVVAVLVVVVVQGSGDTDRPTADQRALGPVLLVPGYGGSTGSLESLAAYLHAHGRTTSVVALPDHAHGDLDAQARVLAAAARSASTRAHAKTVDVVGYSAGGVVARLWVRDHGGAALARRVVTLGSPQHGTSVAALAGSLLPGACPTACHQLATDSDLLDGLNSGDETPAGPTWVSIWTTHDQVVQPPSSASLSGALDFTVQSVCPADTVDHTGLPKDASVQRLVLDVLGAGTPRRPTSCPSSGS